MIFETIEVALRGGDEPIGFNLPTSKPLDAGDTQGGPGGHSRSPASSNGTQLERNKI
jgi:hypothetical protein